MTKTFSSSSFVAGIMVGLLLSGAWFVGDIGTLLPRSSSASATSTPNGADTAAPVSNALIVADQFAGTTVVVDSVAVPAPGVWIAVRDVNGRDLGNVLGAAKVGGPRGPVSVPLLRATEADRTYAVELYRIDADGEFDPAKSSVYVDFDTGERVVVYFSTAP